MGDVVDEALGLLADTGPEYEAFGGRISFANHGPMMIDALVALDRTDTVVEWAARYRPRLDPRPDKVDTIDPSEWRTAPSETLDEIIDEALDCPDEHGIKVTETCLREYQRRPDPVFLVAALSTTRRLNDVGVNLY